MPKQSVYLILYMFLFSLLAGCAILHSFGPYYGKVVDAETNEPIEGAVVYMECFTQTGNPGGVMTRYLDGKEVLTDENGEFKMSLTLTTFRIGHFWRKRPLFLIFKPGYGLFPRHEGTKTDSGSKLLPINKYVTISLPPLKTKKERRKNLLDSRFPRSKKTNETCPNLIRLENIERKYVGLKTFK